MDSILTSVKKLNNVAEEYDVFDIDFIIHINSVFMTLWEMGVGPKIPFSIENKYDSWSNFIPSDNPYFNAVKSYVALKIGMLFDPPSNGTLNNSKEKQIAELEWRLNHAAELNLIPDDIPVTDKVSVEGVELNTNSYTAEQETTTILTAMVMPSNATNKKLIWSSSNDNVAFVHNGHVTLLREGTATITVTTDDGGYTATCVIEVITTEDKSYYILEKLNNSSHADWEAGSMSGGQYWLYSHADSLNQLRGKTVTHIGFIPGVNDAHTLYVYDVDLNKKAPPSNWTLHGAYSVSDCIKGKFKEVDIDDLIIADGHTIGIKCINACVLKEDDGSNVIGLPRSYYTSETATSSTSATNAHWDFKVK